MASNRKPIVPFYVTASFLTSLGGLANGFDTGSIGALTSMSSFKTSIGDLSASQLGFTVSLIMLTGAIPSIFAGALAEKLGRLRAILIGTVFFTIGVAVEASAKSLTTFNVGRAFAGIGEGIYLSSLSVYVCEIAPSSRRGTIASFPQFLATLGVCLGYFTCYGSVHIASPLAWRLPLIIQAVIGVVLAISCLLLPEPPRWLLQHGRAGEARTALDRLDYSAGEAEQFLLTPSGDSQSSNLNPWQSLRLIFRRGYRARTVLALFVLSMVQLSGIDGVLYYAPTLFSQAGFASQQSSFLASGLSAILMLAVSIPALLFADKWGRRLSIISGGLSLSFCMIVIGSLYAAGSVHSYGAARWVVMLLVFWFGMTYSATWGPISKVYASEIQPANTRATANSIAQGLNFLANWFIAIVTPLLLNKSAFGAYFLFGGLALGTVASLALYMPETRGKSLESIQDAFQRPVSLHWAANLRNLVSRGGRRSEANNVGLVSLHSSAVEAQNAPASLETLARGVRVSTS